MATDCSAGFFSRWGKGTATVNVIACALVGKILFSQTPTRSMPVVRNGVAPALLRNGHIRITSGNTTQGGELSPSGDFFARPAPLAVARSKHASAPLQDGCVLEACGIPLRVAAGTGKEWL
ncbi:MAG: hypothetical protein HY647_09250 [Acidobacteria bacterium]|nr:hypothetical protein [Acidobacteriota bacterium]